MSQITKKRSEGLVKLDSIVEIRKFTEKLFNNELVNKFIPTDNELVVLAERYLNVITNLEMEGEFLQSSGSDEVFLFEFSEERLKKIYSFLGEENFQEAKFIIEKKWENYFAILREKDIKFGDCSKCCERVVSLTPVSLRKHMHFSCGCPGKKKKRR